MNTTFFMPSVSNLSAIDVESWFIPVDIITIVFTSLATALTILFLFVLIIDRTCHTTSMMLTANSCLSGLVFGCTLLSLFIFTFQNDLKQIYYQDSLCVFRGYMCYVSSAIFNQSFLIQALYRYVTIVYPTRLFWKTRQCQILTIGVTWIYGVLFPMAFLFTGELIYNGDNQVCQLPFRLSFSILYGAVCVYLIPVSLIMILYFKLVRYVKAMSKRAAPVNILSRAQRDLKIVRRTVILVTILMAVCLPSALLVFISFFNSAPKYHLRIGFITGDLAFLLVIIVLFQFTDPLKTSVLKIMHRQSNMVATIVT